MRSERETASDPLSRSPRLRLGRGPPYGRLYSAIQMQFLSQANANLPPRASLSPSAAPKCHQSEERHKLPNFLGFCRLLRLLDEERPVKKAISIRRGVAYSRYAQRDHGHLIRQESLLPFER